jgi:acetylornithine deacetylase/succinyl-diaminopimelate desuccinylase-like protein
LVDAVRLRALTLELVETPSPTGDTIEVSQLYAERLREIGMDVELHEFFPRTGTVVALLSGRRPGPRIVLNGHLDTVPIPHEPARAEDDRVVGRGAADMKGALACAAETARVLAGSRDFAGELAIVTLGLHEAPSGRGEDLAYLLGEHAFRCDYAIVCELGRDSLPVAHMGQATFEIELARDGTATHELETPPGTPHPLLAAARVLGAIEARTAELARHEHEWVGAETYFVGEVHGGDFYNRHPSRASIVGTRRWAPGRTLADAEAEFRSLLEPIAAETGCRITLDFRRTRDAYRIEPSHPLVQALREGYREVTGRELPLAGVKLVADGALFHEAGIPSVYHGPVGTGAHADFEFVPVDELVRATRVYLATFARLAAQARRAPANASTSPPNGTRA